MSDLIERLRQMGEKPNEGDPIIDMMTDLLREAAAALEAEASEGERRGLERAAEVADGYAADFQKGLVHYGPANKDRGRAAQEAHIIAARDLAAAVRALIPEAPAREGWKPIETAPKDRAILVYDTGQGRCIAYWTQWHDNLLGEDREGWRTMGDWERLDWVTHWMAIPGPPPPQDREPDSQRGAK